MVRRTDDRRRIRRRFLPRAGVVLAFALLWPVLVGFGESAEQRNRAGNKRYRESQYDEALTEYRSAQVLAPELRELAFNAGDALYRKGDLPNALREYAKAAAADDPLLAADAYYNAGNAQTDLGDLGPAVESYKDALRLSSDHEDAKYNLELALRMLEQQQQDQEQDQDQGEQDQDEQDQDDQEQQDQDEQDQQDQDEQEQQDRDEQEQDEQEQDEQDQDEQEQQDQDQQQPEQEMAMSPEDAARLLDAIDQAERELQAELRAAQAKKRQKVEKDW